MNLYRDVLLSVESGPRRGGYISVLLPYLVFNTKFSHSSKGQTCTQDKIT